MIKKILKSYDYTLIAFLILLSIFGLVMVYSASMASAVQRYEVNPDHFYQKQKLFLAGAALVFAFFSVFPYKIMKNTGVLLVIVGVSILSLIGILIFGTVAGNAQSWFEIGPISIQPSEFAKLGVIVYLSAVYAKKQSYINEFNRGVVPPLAYLFIVSLLVAFQPDFGTAAIIVLIAIAIIVSSGMSLKNIIKLMLIGGILVAPIVLVLQDEVFSEKRMSRFEVLADPFADAKDAGFHLSNSFIAIGSGGVTGLGLGKGVQKLGYLPESHTDFIMAVIAEELGIFGSAFVLISLAVIVLKGIYIGVKCKDPFGSLLALGIASMIGIQSAINLAGVSGLIPLTGVPLPFVSYGGSSLLQLAIAAGILVNVSMFANYENKYKNSTAKSEEIPIQKTKESVYRFRTK